MKRFVDLADFRRDEVLALLELARSLQTHPQPQALAGKILGLLFFNPSLRTLASFQAAMARLGGSSFVITPGEGTWRLETRIGAVMDGAAAEHVREGIPVFAQFGLTPQTASKYGIPYSAQNSPQAQATAEAADKLVAEAKLLEDAGAALLDFTNSGPVAGAAVVKAVNIPVIGGFGGGPWLDGRVRLAHTAIGYAEKWIDAKTDTYVNTAKAALDAFTALIADARAGRQIKG